jgi:hypothetical protein
MMHRLQHEQFFITKYQSHGQSIFLSWGKVYNQIFIAAAGRCKVDPSFVFPEMGKSYDQTFRRHLHLQPVGPLNKRDPLAVKIFGEAELLHIFVTAETVEIEMIKRKPPHVDMEEGVGGAGHRQLCPDLKARGHPLDKTGFSRTEFANKGYEVPLLQEKSQPHS